MWRELLGYERNWQKEVAQTKTLTIN